ncbi:hypothetical protein EZS27_004673 [termite gut metagenome]|uniref:Uncharacterized protein n=1 Tax=termite gut metagenome TaxID=433724 RepID=A0A5J4SR94_9ZZZZ
MLNNNQFQFNLSISWNGIDHKPKKGAEEKTFYEDTRFNEDFLTISKLQELISKGHTFAHIFNYKGKVLTCKRKKDVNFSKANCIFIDIDDCNQSMQDTINLLENKPTLAYTTFSNKKEDKVYRFRFMYALNTYIEDIGVYGHIYEEITKEIKEKLNLSYMKDDSCSKASQCVYGSNADCELYSSPTVYELSDFSEYIPKENILKFKDITATKKPIQEKLEIDPHFMDEVKSLTIPQLVHRYEHIHYADKYEIQFKDNELSRFVPKHLYWKINRTYVRETGFDGELHSFVKKFKNGDRRHKKLFQYGIIIKGENPNITPENLIINMCQEVFKHYINTVSEEDLNKRFNPLYIFNMVQDIFNYELVNNRTDDGSLRLMLNMPLLKELGKTYQSEIAKQYNKKKDAKILELLDTLLSFKENLYNLNNVYGIKITYRILKRIYDQNNINPNPTPILSVYEILDTVYNRTLSTSDNVKIITNISRRSIYSYAKDRGINTKGTSKKPKSSKKKKYNKKKGIKNTIKPNTVKDIKSIKNDICAGKNFCIDITTKEKEYITTIYTEVKDCTKLEKIKIEEEKNISIPNLPIPEKIKQPALMTEVTKLYDDSEKKEPDPEDTEISQKIIRNKFNIMKGLLTSTENIHVIETEISSCMYYIEINIPYLKEKDREPTLLAVNKLIDKIRFNYNYNSLTV